MNNQGYETPQEGNLQQEQINENHSLILYNDDENTFDYVIDCLIEVCNHEGIQAEQCAMITHYNGKCDVKLGEFDKLKLMKDKLVAKGLSAVVE